MVPFKKWDVCFKFFEISQHLCTIVYLQSAQDRYGNNSKRRSSVLMYLKNNVIHVCSDETNKHRLKVKK